MKYRYKREDVFRNYVNAGSLLEKVAIASVELLKLYNGEVDSLNSRICEIQKLLDEIETRLERVKKRILISKTKKDILIEKWSNLQTELIDERFENLKQLYSAKDKSLVVQDFMNKFEIQYINEKPYSYASWCNEYVRYNDEDVPVLAEDEGFKKIAQVVLDKFEEAFDSLVCAAQLEKDKAIAKKAEELARGESRIVRIDSILNGKADDGKGGLGD